MCCKIVSVECTIVNFRPSLCISYILSGYFNVGMMHGLVHYVPYESEHFGSVNVDGNKNHSPPPFFVVINDIWNCL